MGLSHSIKNLITSDNCDIHKFFPRTYDLNEMTDFDDFIEDYKFTKAKIQLFKLSKVNFCLGIGIGERIF